MIKVLVVDDHELVRMGITRMLADVSGLQVIGEACDGEQAIRMVRDLTPDVTLMDVKMPGIGGLEATRKILRYDDSAKVIAVTVCEEEPFPTRLMKAGAAGYLSKGADLSEMVRAIRVVYAGQRYISPAIAQAMALRPFNGNETAPMELLSEREMQIMMMIVSCHRVQTISDKLCLSPKTVNTYRYRIFDKLGISSDVEMTLLAMRWGIIDETTATVAQPVS